MTIFHILDRNDWEQAKQFGFLSSDSLIRDGFIHCCTKEQIDFVLDRWFPGNGETIIIKIDSEKLESPVVFEKSEIDQAPFPHVYGIINLDAVVTVDQPKRSRNGKNGQD